MTTKALKVVGMTTKALNVRITSLDALRIVDAALQNVATRVKA